MIAVSCLGAFPGAGASVLDFLPTLDRAAPLAHLQAFAFIAQDSILEQSQYITYIRHSLA